MKQAGEAATQDAAPQADESDEKEAYEGAKELGTLEAWEAFLNNFPTGFRADLARAYVKRLADETSEAPADEETEPTSPAPEAAEAPAAPPSAAETSSEQEEKEAYDAAKELGTVEAWDAFLSNFPEGFRADLARAYLKRLANEPAPAAEETETAAPPADAAEASGATASPDEASAVAEKDAFEAAKELGTVEAWDAFLNAYPQGFRADLARAYLEKLGNTAPEFPASSETDETPPPSPEVTEAPPPPPDISLAMTSQGACTGGESCAMSVTATNSGGQPFNGELVLAASVAPLGASLSSASPQPWFCQEMGGGAVCTNPSVDLEPGQSTSVLITFTLPRHAGGQVTSCTGVSWGGVPTSSSARDVQQALNDAGFDAGPADGKPGRKTAAAIKAYQEQVGLQTTGEIDLPLLLSLFTEPAPGDADPINDQACAGAAVIAAAAPAAAEPQVDYCGGGRIRDPSGACACPATFPYWTGKTCIPRRERNCIGGTYYDRNQKLCLCPSRRPYWYNDRCHGTLNECPDGGAVVGNVCVRQFNRGPFPPGSNGHYPNRQAFCPPNLTLVGNSCVNLSNAPVFGFGRGGFQGRRPRRRRRHSQCRVQAGRTRRSERDSRRQRRWRQIRRHGRCAEGRNRVGRSEGINWRPRWRQRRRRQRRWCAEGRNPDADAATSAAAEHDHPAAADRQADTDADAAAEHNHPAAADRQADADADAAASAATTGQRDRADCCLPTWRPQGLHLSARHHSYGWQFQWYQSSRLRAETAAGRRAGDAATATGRKAGDADAAAEPAAANPGPGQVVATAVSYSRTVNVGLHPSLVPKGTCVLGATPPELHVRVSPDLRASVR